MAQHDYTIANQGFPATRSDINNALSAIATNNSGTSAPSTQYAGQFWIDTTASTWTLYIHDGTDDIQFATIDTSANTVNFVDSALDVVTDTTPQLGGNLDVNGNSIVSTSNADITLAPDGTGDVVLSADTVKIGDSNTNATITTDGTGDLILNTNSGSSSGSITIADGANGAITVAPNGTGTVTVTGNLSVDSGTIKLDGNYPVGTDNVALGDGALDDGSLTGGYNVAIGTNALTANTTGCENTAVGRDALGSNTTGYQNVAIGNCASLASTDKFGIVAVGYSALICSDVTAATAVGYAALEANTTGGSNTAVGFSALRGNTTGCSNTALGTSALRCITTGVSNTAVGTCTLLCNTTGIFNTAVGSIALDANTTGDNNTVSGYSSLSSNTTGDNNAAFGAYSLRCLTTGSNNTALGYISGADAVCCITTQSNVIVMGNNSHTVAKIKVAWTVTSDARDKTCINTVSQGLDFVKQLEPISYRFKKSREDESPSGRTRYGFKAQDILELEGEEPVIIDNDNPDNLSYNESSLVPVLVNAIKELTKKIESLESK